MLTEAERVDVLRRVEAHALVDADGPAVAVLVQEGLVRTKVKRGGRVVAWITDAGAALLDHHGA